MPAALSLGGMGAYHRAESGSVSLLIRSLGHSQDQEFGHTVDAPVAVGKMHHNRKRHAHLRQPQKTIGAGSWPPTLQNPRALLRRRFHPTQPAVFEAELERSFRAARSQHLPQCWPSMASTFPSTLEQTPAPRWLPLRGRRLASSKGPDRFESVSPHPLRHCPLDFLRRIESDPSLTQSALVFIRQQNGPAI